MPEGTPAAFGLVPVGEVVMVTPFEGPPYRALVVGYDVFRTKYNLGREYLPGRFGDGGWWAFLHRVEALGEQAPVASDPGASPR